VLRAAAESGAAVVVTLHNYRLMCIAGTFFREGKVCQDCLGRSPLSGVVHACYRTSRAESAVIAASLVAARSRGMLDSVHRFFAVSAFVREKHIEGGIDPERILVKPNVVGEQVRRRGAGRHFLILSRLSVEKGIAPIVESWSSDLGELVIAGDGPELAKIEKLAHGRGVRLLGAVAPAEIPPLLGAARAVLVPSTWYEGQPRTILEAYASGVPVIGSRIGGIDELIEDGATGVTVPLNDSGAWRAAASMLADDDLCVRLGDAAHARWEERFSPRRGLTTLEAGYREALEARSART
jgi:glycosyltransferase involved in cell wall biosynthesis